MSDRWEPVIGERYPTARGVVCEVACPFDMSNDFHEMMAEPVWIDGMEHNIIGVEAPCTAGSRRKGLRIGILVVPKNTELR